MRIIPERGMATPHNPDFAGDPRDRHSPQDCLDIKVNLSLWPARRAPQFRPILRVRLLRIKLGRRSRPAPSFSRHLLPVLKASCHAETSSRGRFAARASMSVPARMMALADFIRPIKNLGIRYSNAADI
jgi:hypothetical protein